MSNEKYSTVDEPIVLPCGTTLSNRLVKAALAEQLAINGVPDKSLLNLYTAWGKGGWGAVMTGHVMVDSKFTGGPGARDTEIPRPSDKSADRFEPWRAIASAIKAEGSKAIMQINHPGRQSPLGAGTKGWCEKNVAPSAVTLDLGKDFITRTIVKFVWGTPAAMTGEQVLDLIAAFVDAAKVAKQTGFDGVEVHSAHGYLLSSFLSPDTNLRTDAWGGSPAKRAAVIVEIIRGIRKEVGKDFIIGVKMNSADQTQQDALQAVIEQIAVLAAEEIDFLEISGGTYEDPKMVNGNGAVGAKSGTTSAREAFFLDFALEARRQFPDLNLMLTGGFRTRSAMNDALETKACDIIGVGRPAIVKPDFPRSVIGIGSKEPLTDAEAGFQLVQAETPKILTYLPKKLGRALAGGVESIAYTLEMKKTADAQAIMV